MANYSKGYLELRDRVAALEAEVRMLKHILISQKRPSSPESEDVAMEEFDKALKTMTEELGKISGVMPGLTGTLDFDLSSNPFEDQGFKDEGQEEITVSGIETNV
jgi:hypothetical protein